MEISIENGSIEIDTDEIVEAVKEEFSEFIAEYVDYHSDKFSISWMRMQERELNDLQCSTKDGACDHGQKVYRALFRVIEEFLKHHSKEDLEAMIGQYLGGEDEEDYDEYEEEAEVVPTVLQPVAPSTMTWTVSQPLNRYIT